jgi:hypothetical protein
MSEPSRPYVSLEVVREAVKRAVGQRSLRRVAREVGLSPRGLTLFLEGNRSQSGTALKLRDWYVMHGAAAVGVSGDTAAASLNQLLDGLEDADREQGMIMILGTLDMLYRRRKKTPPPWIEDLLHRRL